MRYMLLAPAERESLLQDLASMPEVLESTFGGLSRDDAVLPGPAGSFSPVEQCWHLADLEREGFRVRIRRLLEEDDPLLPDFDGAAVAEQRDYKRLSLSEGTAAFRKARLEALAALRQVTAADWYRAGRQEGVGRISLCDIPTMMAEHDQSHRREIEAWAQARTPRG